MKKLSELDLNELIQKRNTLKACLISFGILGVLILSLLIFLKAKVASFIPVMVLPITWMPLLISLKSVNDEIKLRNGQSGVAEGSVKQ